VIASGGARVAITIVGFLVVAGAMAGCSRGVVASGSDAPAAGVTAVTPTPAPTTGVSDSTLQDIQSDLNSTDSATTNADGDVTDADNSAATSDSP
jgi:hypothetical protein